MKKKYVIAALISYLLLVLFTFYFKLSNTAYASIKPGDSTLVNQKQMMFFGTDEMGELRIEAAVFNFNNVNGRLNGQLAYWG
jgi:hypothetical protein